MASQDASRCSHPSVVWVEGQPQRGGEQNRHRSPCGPFFLLRDLTLPWQQSSLGPDGPAVGNGGLVSSGWRPPPTRRWHSRPGEGMYVSQQTRPGLERWLKE